MIFLMKYFVLKNINIVNTHMFFFGVTVHIMA